METPVLVKLAFREGQKQHSMMRLGEKYTRDVGWQLLGVQRVNAMLRVDSPKGCPLNKNLSEWDVEAMWLS